MRVPSKVQGEHEVQLMEPGRSHWKLFLEAVRIFSLQAKHSYQEGVSHPNINEPYPIGTFLNTVTFQLGATVDFCLSFLWQVITSEEEIRLPLGELSCDRLQTAACPLCKCQLSDSGLCGVLGAFAICFSKMPGQIFFIVSTPSAEGILYHNQLA